MKTSSPLHILVTNDDGHHAPGIQALNRVLKQSGHRVSMVAPSSEQSATGMSVTSRRNLPLEQLAEGSWHLDGQPVDTVLVALRHLSLKDCPCVSPHGLASLARSQQWDFGASQMPPEARGGWEQQLESQQLFASQQQQLYFPYN